MGELGFNKIFGAFLATVLVVMGLREVSNLVFPGGGYGGGHYGEDHDGKSLNEQLAARYAYYVEVADAGGGPVVEDVFDLGLALANADPARGETAFKAKCATCHTVEQGGTNGTGPNLFATIGADKEHIAGFNYSGVLADIGGQWTYQNMNDWLKNPTRYARGTSMAFAGLRRDDERANVIAYLTQYTPDAPPYPDPLPESGETADAEGDAVATEVAVDTAGLENPGLATGVVETVDVVDAANDPGNAAGEIELAPVAIDADLFFPEGSAEAGLVNFLQSDREPCTDPDCWYTAQIMFASDSAVVDAAASAQQLAGLKQVLDNYPTMQLKIGGYTDNSGDAQANLTLSQQRADAVAAALVGLGVSVDRVVAEGYGAEFPVASNDTPEGRAQNRRIDVRVRER